MKHVISIFVNIEKELLTFGHYSIWGFPESPQSFVRPWALILGGRLYGANI